MVTKVSILISVDSGLIHDERISYSDMFICFNPYFSGFRSYTGHVNMLVSNGSVFQSLFQWIPVLYAERCNGMGQRT